MTEQRQFEPGDWLATTQGRVDLRLYLDADRHQPPPPEYISFTGKRMYVADAIAALESYEGGRSLGVRVITRKDWASAPDAIVEAAYDALFRRFGSPR